MDAGDLRDELGFFGRGGGIDNGFGHGNLFRQHEAYEPVTKGPDSTRSEYECRWRRRQTVGHSGPNNASLTGRP
jgi:hypothetical protein